MGAAAEYQRTTCKVVDAGEAVETFAVKMTTSGNSVYANFYMLVPVTVSTNIYVYVNSSKITVLSFPAQIGFKYLVVYKNNLNDANWKTLKYCHRRHRDHERS